MKRMILLRTGFISMVIGFLALQASAAFAQARQLSPELRAKLTAGYEEMRRQNPQLADRSPEQIAADLDALSRAQHARWPDTSTVTARSAAGSVAAAARCKEGYIVKGSHRADDPSVRILAETKHDCDARGCRSYEVRAASDGTKPFTLTVSVACST